MDQGTTRPHYLQHSNTELKSFHDRTYQYKHYSEKPSENFQSSYSKQKYHHQHVQNNTRLQLQSNLIEATKESDKARVKELLKNGDLDLDARDSEGHAPLYWACCRGNTDICRSLLQAGCDVNARGNNGGTALIACADNGHEQCLRLLLKVRAIDLDLTSVRGDTALHMAAYRGFPGIVGLLCQAGANTNLENSNDQTPRTVARVSNQMGCFNELSKIHTIERPNKHNRRRHNPNDSDRQGPIIGEEFIFSTSESSRKELPEEDIHFVSTDSGVDFSSSYIQSYIHPEQPSSRSPVCSDERLPSIPDDFHTNHNDNTKQEQTTTPLKLTTTLSSDYSKNHCGYQSRPTFVQNENIQDINNKAIPSQLNNKDNNLDVTLVSKEINHTHCLPNVIDSSVNANIPSHDNHSPPHRYGSSNSLIPFTSTSSTLIKCADADSDSSNRTTSYSYPYFNDLSGNNAIRSTDSNNLLFGINADDEKYENDTIYKYNIIGNKNPPESDGDKQNDTKRFSHGKVVTTTPYHLNIAPVSQKSASKSQPSLNIQSFVWGENHNEYLETLQMKLVTQEAILQQERSERAQMQTENHKLKTEIIKLKEDIQKLDIPKQIYIKPQPHR